MKRKDQRTLFDPDGVGDKRGGIFGLPFTVDEAKVVVLPVPWDVTVSYRAGTSRGPQAILDASFQVDLYDADIADAWKLGLAMDDIPRDVLRKSGLLRKKSERYIGALERGQSPDQPALRNIREEINQACQAMNERVRDKAGGFLDRGKLVALVGGDHSTPLGFLQALARRYPAFAILQIDAHADLREAYEGFMYSHASIMDNALKIPQVKRLAQVGIRDYCQAEADRIQRSRGRIKTWFDRDIKRALFNGKQWSGLCGQIVKSLPRHVYISFDIDGLDPKLCPHTGTPVAGGFEWDQALFLIERLVKAGKEIIGFDINEVAPGPGEWDANVGARLLYRMANLMALSRGRFKTKPQ